MGYRKQPKRYRLKFEDHPGLEVTMGSVAVGDFLELAKLVTDTNAEAVGKLLGIFADALVSWNLEDDAGAVPADVKGVAAQDFDFVLELVMAWMEAIASVDTPLKQPSASSPPSGLGLSEAMAPLSGSPGS